VLDFLLGLAIGAAVLYVIGVVVFTLMYLSWFGPGHGAAIGASFHAALHWPEDVVDRLTR
jgi:hypothetical protein